MATRLAIACSNQIFAEGLRKILEDERDIHVVGIFNGINGFLADFKAIVRLSPDILLAENTPEFNKLADLSDGLYELKKIKIILIGDRQTQFMSDKFVRDLISKGMLGILPPSADAELLHQALRVVQDGEVWLDRESLIKLLSAVQRPEKYIRLGKREKEIITHICQGYRNREIANKLNISEQTVKSYCNRIYKKLGVSGRLQLALFSQKNLSDSLNI